MSSDPAGQESVPQNEADGDAVYNEILASCGDFSEDPKYPAGLGNVDFGTRFVSDLGDTDGSAAPEQEIPTTEDIPVTSQATTALEQANPTTEDSTATSQATESNINSSHGTGTQIEPNAIVNESQCSSVEQDRSPEAGPQHDPSSTSSAKESTPNQSNGVHDSSSTNNASESTPDQSNGVHDSSSTSNANESTPDQSNEAHDSSSTSNANESTPNQSNEAHDSSSQISASTPFVRSKSAPARISLTLVPRAQIAWPTTVNQSSPPDNTDTTNPAVSLTTPLFQSGDPSSSLEADENAFYETHIDCQQNFGTALPAPNEQSEICGRSAAQAQTATALITVNPQETLISTYLPLDAEGNVVIGPSNRYTQQLEADGAPSVPTVDNRPEFTTNKIVDHCNRSFENVLHYVEVNQDVLVKALDRCPEVVNNHLNANNAAVKSFLDTNPDFLEQYLTKNTDKLKNVLNSKMIAAFLAANPDSLTKALSQDYISAALGSNSKKVAKALGQNQDFLNHHLADNPAQLIKALKANPGLRNCAYQEREAVYTVAMNLHMPASQLNDAEAPVNMVYPTDLSHRKQVLEARRRFEEMSELMGEPIDHAGTSGHLEIPDDDQIAAQQVANHDEDDSDSDGMSNHSDDDQYKPTGRGLGKGLPPYFNLQGKRPPGASDDEDDDDTTTPTGGKSHSETTRRPTGWKGVKSNQGINNQPIDDSEVDDGQPESANTNLKKANFAQKHAIIIDSDSEPESDADPNSDAESDAYAESDSDAASDDDSGPEEGEIVETVEIAEAVDIPPTKYIPYPAPQHLIDASRLQRSRGNQWTLWEEERAIFHMLAIRDEAVISGEGRFREVSTRLAEEEINRGWMGVKNFWNRAGRLRSGFDERKNKNAPLATSAQGKQAKAKKVVSKATKPKTDRKGKNPTCKKGKPSKRKRSEESSDDDDWSAPAKKKGKMAAGRLSEAELRSAQLGLRNTGIVKY